MKRHVAVFFIMVLSLSFLAGCWSKKELNDLAIVSAVALDLDKQGRFIGTFQFVNPGNVTGGFQGGGGGQGNAVSVYSAKGDNMDEISRRMSTKVSRNLYYAHANLLVISEELAKKKGILPILDAFDRDPTFRNTATVVISHQAKAADLVKTLTAIDKIPANKMIKMLRFSERVYGGTMNVMIMDVVRDLTDDGKQPVISGLNLKGSAETGKTLQNIMQTTPESAPQIGGLALFKDGKLTGWLNGSKARGAVWTLNKIKKTEININKKGKKAAIVLEVIRQNTKISATTIDGTAHLMVKVETEGNIGETKVPINLKDPMVIKRLEYGFEGAIEKEIKSAITVAQKKKTDIFGFGDAVHRSQPETWKRISKNWDEDYFAKANVKIKVDVFVRRTGLRSNSFLSDVK
ncbi:spore germination protein KC [Fictibacillus enclensis]|uniref:Spore gernimation protein KC n=1 Tax=Fictibacillus enclensis TaxID=1017270 RepID=A0A0V8J4U4_9BACL|nr:Ger(x)C family spore germination protein [Fictibacillus enclensis]KSU81940.1 spore gernimation protein KC [Fictibacillus enclensis]SCC28150.1 spore germination protein KC [Fictibacillus enclensis]